MCKGIDTLEHRWRPGGGRSIDPGKNTTISYIARAALRRRAEETCTGGGGFASELIVRLSSDTINSVFEACESFLRPESKSSKLINFSVRHLSCFRSVFLIHYEIHSPFGY